MFTESSADDLMHESLSRLREQGEHIEPTRGPALELQSVVLELANPLARLSRSETRGRVFSALGELCWYLAGSNSTDFIAYYLSRYREEDEGGSVHGAYGPRLLAYGGFDQIAYVVERLKEDPSSRQAVIQLFDHDDVAAPHKHVPCTCTFQFLVRGGRMLMLTHMRSNDAFIGLPHDMFAFTMIQELVARSVGVPLGTYIHLVGSFHLYERDFKAAEAYLGEGWHSNMAMPEMPPGDPWPSVQRLLQVENDLRTNAIDPMQVTADDEPYWADLARLLAIFRLRKSGRTQDVATIQSGLTSRVFDAHIADSLERV